MYFERKFSLLKEDRRMLIISVSLGNGSLISHLVVYSECFKDFSTLYKFYVKSLNSMFSLYMFVHKPLYTDQNPYKKILDLDQLI